MKLQLAVGLLPVFVFLGAAQASIPKPVLTWKQEIEKPVRVRLASGLNTVRLQGFGLRVQGGSASSNPIAMNRMGSLEIERVKTEMGWFWRIKKSEGKIERFELKKAEALVIEGEDLRKGTQDLPGRLVLTSKMKGFDLIGVLPIENYLVGVLSSEMPLAWPLEALKSQAVAARSYTLALMRERRHLHYDVESTILDQVFNHVSRKLDNDKMIAKARRAVEETSGVVLLNQKSQVAKAYYHADCGGRTTAAKNVWGTGEKGPVIVDSSCPGHPRSKWTLSLTVEEIRAKLSKKFDIPTDIESLLALAPSAQDRAERLKIRLVDGRERTVNADEFRAALGYSDLRSTFFKVERQGDHFEFKGQGWGHGVGLCQWGSRRMAEMGSGASEILRHYYPLSPIAGEIRNSPRVASRRTAGQE